MGVLFRSKNHTMIILAFTVRLSAEILFVIQVNELHYLSTFLVLVSKYESKCLEIKVTLVKWLSHGGKSHQSLKICSR